MAINSHNKFFRELARTGNLDPFYLDLIKNADIYRQAPAASLRQFTKAFKSPKTPKSVRYLMIVSVLTGDPGLINRAMRVDVKNADYAIEPVYKPRIGLSHFKVTGIGHQKKTFDPKMNPRVRRLLMGSPISTTRGKMVATLMQMQKDPTVQAKLKNYKQGDYIKDILKPQLAAVPKIVSSYEPEIANVPLEGLSRVLKKIGYQPATKFEANLLNLSSNPRLQKPVNYCDWWIRRKRFDRLIKRLGDDHKKVFYDPLVCSGLPSEYVWFLVQTMIEISKHLEGLIWVLGTFIKLNDHRHLVYDSDPPLNADKAYQADSRTINLHGFTEHLSHYHWEIFKKYRMFFMAVNLVPEAIKVECQLYSLFTQAIAAEAATYEDEEEAQDELDILINYAARLLNHAADLLFKIANPDIDLRENLGAILEVLVKYKEYLISEELTHEHNPHRSKKVKDIETRYVSDTQMELWKKVSDTKKTLQKWNINQAQQEKLRREKERLDFYKHRQWMLRRPKKEEE